MRPASLQLAMFDMAGTTVNDRVEGIPLMILSMTRAFASHDIRLTSELINRHRGKEKLEAIQTLLQENSSLPSDEIDRISAIIYRDFVQELESNLRDVSEIDGASETFQYLKSRGIFVGVGSGFPARVVEAIVSQLGWRENGLVDYVGSAEQVGVGRPNPKMIHDAMQQLGVTKPQKVVKIGDTIVDIQEGKNADVWTIAVLTGSQTEEQLMTVQPDYILSSIRALPEVLQT
ncbi:HAD-IA family hydrolase [Candidatus Poribacteria bacterium]|nr:HAD-IA family hydrolase [Candidatus Poribacteria bacterium]